VTFESFSLPYRYCPICLFQRFEKDVNAYASLPVEEAVGIVPLLGDVEVEAAELFLSGF